MGQARLHTISQAIQQAKKSLSIHIIHDQAGIASFLLQGISTSIRESNERHALDWITFAVLPSFQRVIQALMLLPSTQQAHQSW
jgi:hypothetical protein